MANLPEPFEIETFEHYRGIPIYLINLKVYAVCLGMQTQSSVSLRALRECVDRWWALRVN